MDTRYRFEAVEDDDEYYTGPLNWYVVEWTHTNELNGSRAGRRVSNKCLSQDSAEEIARDHNQKWLLAQGIHALDLLA